MAVSGFDIDRASQREKTMERSRPERAQRRGSARVPTGDRHQVGRHRAQRRLAC
jgi:hypothetical protein